MNSANKDYVSFQHVKKTYDGTNLVVKDFNLDIAPGEFVTPLIARSLNLNRKRNAMRRQHESRANLVGLGIGNRAPSS